MDTKNKRAKHQTVAKSTKAKHSLLHVFMPTQSLSYALFLTLCSAPTSLLARGCPSARYERLEDQLNDLTELHQHETSNLKQELASIEEKVAYQAYERARDIQVTEAAAGCSSYTALKNKGNTKNNSS